MHEPKPVAPGVKYRRVILKLSGEVLQDKKNGDSLDAAVLVSIAQQIKKVRDLGVQVAVVVGGGNTAVEEFVDACARIDTLDLKFILHAGEFVLQSIGGGQELVGPDVVMAHRLLKTHAAEVVGARQLDAAGEVGPRRRHVAALVVRIAEAALGKLERFAKNYGYQNRAEVADSVAYIKQKHEKTREKVSAKIKEAE